MTFAWVKTAALSLLAALFLLGCERPVVHPKHDGLAWHTEEPPQYGHPGWAQKEYIQFALPEARYARRDTAVGYGSIPRMVVNVLPDGKVRFKGQTFPFSTGTPEEREASQIALLDELLSLTANPEWRDERGRSLCPTLLHCDRSTTWSAAADILRTILMPGPNIYRIQWAVNRHVHPDDWAVSAEVDALTADDPGAAPVQVRLAGREVGEETDVTIDVGERTWSFGSGRTDYDDADFVDRANEVWAEAETALRGVSSDGDRAVLAIEGKGVTWGHVATAFDILLGAGVRTVDLPAVGRRFAFSAPEPPLPAREDEPVLTPLAIGAVVLGLLLGVFVVLWPLRGARRRRGSGQA